MNVSFRVREISRGTRKLTRTPTLINIKKNFYFIDLQSTPLASISLSMHLTN
jgi:hypothetical protein